MFNHFADMKGRFTHENHDGVEFLWVKIPNYNPKNYTRFLAMFFFAGVLWRLIFKTKLIGKPDYIIHSSMSVFPAPVVNWLSRRLKAKKFVFEVRDIWPLTAIKLMGYSPEHPFIRFMAWFEKYAYRHADEIVSLLNGSEKHINPISGNPSKYNLVPNGIHHSLLEASKNSPEVLPQLAPDKITVGYTGTVGFANALEPLFDVVKNHPELGERFQFVILGDGYKKQEFVDLVGHLKYVHFVPKVLKEEVGAYVKRFDICFIAWHNSELYQYGVSANKYFDFMAAAKPVLAANNGIKDPVFMSKSGLCVNNTETDIREGLKTFAAMSHDERELIGQRGFDYVRENSMYEKLGNDYLKVLTK